MQNDKWFSSFKKGFVTCFVICGAIAGVAGYLIDRLLDLKEAEIDRARAELARVVDVSEKYQKEQVLRTRAESDAASLEATVQRFNAEKWPEKYRAERVAHQATTERLAVLQARYEGLAKQVEEGAADTTEDLEIAQLKTELEIVTTELQRIRELYTKLPEEPRDAPRVVQQLPVRVEVVFRESTEDLARRVCDALKSADFDAQTVSFEGWSSAVNARLAGESHEPFPHRSLLVRDRVAPWLNKIQNVVSSVAGGAPLETPTIGDGTIKALGLAPEEAVIMLLKE